MAVDREFYVYRFGRPQPGRTDGRADDRGPRPGGRTAGTILNDSTTNFSDFHKTTQLSNALLAFAINSRARVPIITPKMKQMEFARLARFARFAPGNGIFDAARDPENLRTGARMT